MTAEDRKIEELLLHLRGLMFVHEILEQHGAAKAELDRHSTELTLTRARLARERRRAWTTDTRAA